METRGRGESAQSTPFVCFVYFVVIVCQPRLPDRPPSLTHHTMQVTLSSKGHLVLPPLVRRQLGLKARTRLTLEPREDGLFLRPIETAKPIAPIRHLPPGAIKLSSRDYEMDRIAGEDDVPAV